MTKELHDKEAPFGCAGDVPLKRTAILKLERFDNSLADIVMNFLKKEP